MTLIAGQLTALCVLLILQWLLTEEQLHDWGWRIPFFIGACLAVVVFRIRRGLLETQSFKNAQEQKDQPESGLFSLFKHYPKEAFTVLFFNSWGYIGFLYLHHLFAKISGQYLWL